MSYPNIYRQSETLINSIVQCFVIKFDKLKEILSKGDYSRKTVNALRHQATNYNDLTSYEKLQQYASELTDYSGYATEVVHMILKNLINEKVMIQVLPYVSLHKLEMQEAVDSEEELLHYKSFEDSTVEAELAIMKTQIGGLDELIKQLQAEQLSSKTKIEELESKLDQYIDLTNEFLVVRAEDASKIKSLEESHAEAHTAQALQAYSLHKLEEDNNKLSAEVSELWKFANFSKESIIEHQEVIGVQRVQIDEQQVQIGVLTNTVEVQQVQIEVLTTDVKEKTVRIEALEYKVGEQHIVICEQQQELTEHAERINTLEERVDKISLSVFNEEALELKVLLEENLKVGTVITPELQNEVVTKVIKVVSTSYSTGAYLKYTKAPTEEISKWKKIVDAVRTYLSLLHMFRLNPVNQLQMINSIERDYYEYDLCANTK